MSTSYYIKQPLFITVLFHSWIDIKYKKKNGFLKRYLIQIVLLTQSRKKP